MMRNAQKERRNTMANIQLFQNPEFGKLEVLLEDGKVLFPASDVAKILGYSNPRKAIIDHCKGVTKRDGVSTTINQHGMVTDQSVEKNYIPEGDVIRLIIKSRLPEAQRIESWIFDEIVPSVIKTGAYVAPTADRTDQETRYLRAQAMLTNAEVRKAKQLMIMAKDYEGLLSAQSSELLAIDAIEVLTGKNTLPRPRVEKTYSAEDIGKEIGISANAVGRLATKHNLKTDEYGMTILGKAQHNDSQRPTFRYNEKGKAEIARLANVQTIHAVN